MTTTKTYPWDVAEHLQTKEDIVAYLEAALEEGDPELIVVALKDIAHCQKMKQVIEQNDSVYQALLTNNNPDFVTILKAFKMFGLRLQAATI
ncbi:MAG: addiction module antidote protein [Microcystaceae cyanobacterium]